MLRQVWTALSGVSGVALVCCLLSAAVVLRWTGRRTARGAAARARRRQRAGLETMDKAVQRFRLQVTAGAGAGVGGRGEHSVGKAALSAAWTPEGRLAGSADESLGTEPLLELTHSVLFPRQVQREEKRKRKGQDRSWSLGAVLTLLCARESHAN